MRVHWCQYKNLLSVKDKVFVLETGNQLKEIWPYSFLYSFITLYKRLHVFEKVSGTRHSNKIHFCQHMFFAVFG